VIIRITFIVSQPDSTSTTQSRAAVATGRTCRLPVGRRGPRADHRGGRRRSGHCDARRRGCSCEDAQRGGSSRLHRRCPSERFRRVELPAHQHHQRLRPVASATSIVILINYWVRKVMAAYRRVDDLRSVTCGLTACSLHRDQLRAQRSVSSMGSLYLLPFL